MIQDNAEIRANVITTRRRVVLDGRLVSSRFDSRSRRSRGSKREASRDSRVWLTAAFQSRLSISRTCTYVTLQSASSTDSRSLSRARQLVNRKRAGVDPNSLAFGLCRPQAIRARPRHGKQWLAYYALRGNSRMNTPFMPAEPPAHRPQ